MPQLNPAPWLYLLLLTWASLALYMIKMVNMTFSLSLTTSQTRTTPPIWYWPWQ